MKDRIRQLMEELHLTQQSFAKETGINTATLSNVLAGKSKPTLDIVDKIRLKFSNLNVLWLMYGQGEMFGGADGSSFASADSPVSPASDSPTSSASWTNDDAPRLTEGGDGPAISFIVDEQRVESRPKQRQQTTAGYTQPSLFDQPQMHSVNNTRKNPVQNEVKYIDKPQRKITEIRIFYDDQTWETFVPKK